MPKKLQTHQKKIAEQKKQYAEILKSINNMLDAIQKGIITSSLFTLH